MNVVDRNNIIWSLALLQRLERAVRLLPHALHGPSARKEDLRYAQWEVQIAYEDAFAFLWLELLDGPMALPRPIWWRLKNRFHEALGDLTMCCRDTPQPFVVEKQGRVIEIQPLVKEKS